MTQAIEKRDYGLTGEQVTVVGLGGAYLAKHSLADGVATVRRALKLGINYFDTSPAYGNGASQVIIGNALQGSQKSYLLATKLGYLATPADFRSTDALRAQLWENLRALQRTTVDVLQVHLAELACWWQDGASDGELVNPKNTYDFANAPVMTVLRKAKARGLCRFIGVTSDNAEIVAFILRHVEVDVCLVAYGYNLVYRHARRSAMRIAHEKSIAYIAAGIFKPDFVRVHPEWITSPPQWLTPDLRSRFARLYDLHKECDMSLVTLSVRYLVGDPDITTILVGAATPAELAECVTAARQGALPPDLHRAVEELALP